MIGWFLFYCECRAGEGWRGRKEVSQERQGGIEGKERERERKEGSLVGTVQETKTKTDIHTSTPHRLPSIRNEHNLSS